MQEIKLKIRKDLIITQKKNGQQTIYLVLNPLTKKTNSFSQKTFLIFRHFNSRNILEVKRHLEEKHRFKLSFEVLEVYQDLFLDLYLFEDCLELYWERLDNLKKKILSEEIKDLVKNWEEKLEPFFLVESMLLNETINALKEKDISKAIEYLSELLRINSQNTFAKGLKEEIEKKIIEIGTRAKLFVFAEEWKEKVLELSYASIVGILLFLGISLGSLLFLSGRNNLSRISPEHLKIIQRTSDTLLQVKLDIL